MVLTYDLKCNKQRKIAVKAADIIKTMPELDPVGSHTPLRQCALIRDALFHAIQYGKTTKADVKKRIHQTLNPQDDEPYVRTRTQRTKTNKNASSLSPSASEDGTEKNQNSLIHQTVINLQSGNKQEKEQACKKLTRFIHFYLRKIRYRGPTRYRHNEKIQTGGTQIYDFEDATQYILLHMLENITKIDLTFDEAQIKVYINTMIQRAYGKWKINKTRLVRIPENIYQENLSYKNNLTKQQYISINQPLLCCEDKETIHVQEIIKDLHDNTTPEINSLKHDAQTKINELLNALPTKMSTIITLRFLHGKPLKEIGNQVGLSAERTRQIIEDFQKALTTDGPTKKGFGKAKIAFQNLQSIMRP